MVQTFSEHTSDCDATDDAMQINSWYKKPSQKLNPVTKN